MHEPAGVHIFPKFSQNSTHSRVYNRRGSGRRINQTCKKGSDSVGCGAIWCVFFH